MISYEEAKNLLDYNAETGEFIWRKANNRRILVGSIAGTTNDQGYRIICINKNDYRAHRLAWLLHYGRWPNGDIDHQNCIRNDNRIINLRECSRTQNLMNMKTERKNNKSGFKGVHWCKIHRKWVAKIGLNGKRRTIGYFASKEAAFEARGTVATKLYGGFARNV